jgi:SlyX protein
MDEKRIIDLEIRFSHLDDYIDQLNKIVTAQQKTIDRLEKEVLDLKMNSTGGAVDSTRTLKDDKPPHY